TLPLIVNLSLLHFMGEGRVIPLQFDKILQVFAIVLVPVGVGMLLRHNKPLLAERMEKPVKILSSAFLAIIVVAAVLKERDNVVTFLELVGLAALAFNLASMAVGYLIPLMARLPKRQAVAIGMEIGIHNG